MIKYKESSEIQSNRVSREWWIPYVSKYVLIEYEEPQSKND